MWDDRNKARLAAAEEGLGKRKKKRGEIQTETRPVGGGVSAQEAQRTREGVSKSHFLNRDARKCAQGSTLITPGT